MAENIESLLHNVGNEIKALSLSFPGGVNHTLVFDEGKLIGGNENSISFDFDKRRRFSLHNATILSMSRADADNLEEVKQWRHNYIIGILTDIMTSGEIQSYNYDDKIPRDINITYIEPMSVDDALEEASNEYDNRIDSFARVGIDSQPLNSVYLQSSLTESENDVDLFIIFAAEAFVSLNEAIMKSGGFKLSDIYEGIADRINNKDLELVDYDRVSIFASDDEEEDTPAEPVYNLDDESTDVNGDEEYYPDTVSKLSEGTDDISFDDDSEDNDIVLDENNDADFSADEQKEKQSVNETPSDEDNADTPVEESVSEDDTVQEDESDGDADNDTFDDISDADEKEEDIPPEAYDTQHDEEDRTPLEEHSEPSLDEETDVEDDDVHDTDDEVEPDANNDIPSEEPEEDVSTGTDSSHEFIAFLESNIQDIHTNIDTENKAIAEAEERVKSLDHSEEMTTMSQEIAELKSKTARFESMLDSVRAEQEKNSSEIEASKQKIHDSQSKIADFERNRDWLLKTQETLRSNGLL
jgi:hypothetical protein